MVFGHVVDKLVCLFCGAVSSMWSFMGQVVNHYMAVFDNGVRMINPFITAVDPSMHTDSFPYFCQYCSKCVFFSFFSMSKVYKYLF